MAISNPILLNGVSYTPKDIDHVETPIGDAYEARNGARRFAQRAVKSEWKLTFEGLTLAQLTTLRALLALAATFTYRDENLVSYTVLIRQPLSNTRPIIQPDKTIYYAATLTIEEA